MTNCLYDTNSVLSQKILFMPFNCKIFQNKMHTKMALKRANDHYQKRLYFRDSNFLGPYTTFEQLHSNLEALKSLVFFCIFSKALANSFDQRLTP